MFIFNALVLSLTRSDFFSRAIIEPRVQTPLPAPPDYNNKLQQRLDQLKRLIPTNLLDAVINIADRRADKTAQQCRTNT